MSEKVKPAKSLEVAPTDRERRLAAAIDDPFKPERAKRVDRKRLAPDDLRRMNVPDEFWSRDRAGWDKLTPSIRPVVENYFKNFEASMHAGLGFTLIGDPGVGKTATVVVALKAARERMRSAYFIRVSEMRDALRREVEFDSTETVVERCHNVEFLGLDAFGESDLTAPWFGLMQLRELILARASRCRPTFLTFGVTKSRVMSIQPDFFRTTGKHVPDFEVTGGDRNEEGRRQAKALLLGKGGS